MKLRATALAGAVLAAAALPAVAVPSSATAPVTDFVPICSTALPPAENDPTATHLPRAGGASRIGSFNILHAQAPDKNRIVERLPLIIAALLDADLDAVGLQEVMGEIDPVSGTSGPDEGLLAGHLALALATAYGEPWHWCWSLSNPHFPLEPDGDPGGGGLLSTLMAGANPTNPGFREGLAVLSRHPITDARARRQPPRSYEAPLCDPSGAVANPLGCPAEAVFDSRQILWTEITPAAGGAFDLFTTHIAHGLTEASPYTKLLHVELALDTVAEWADPATPTFLVGDFNSVETAANDEPTDRYGAVVDAGFTDTFRAFTTAAGSTSDQSIVTATPEPTVTSRIDFVFAKSACGVGVADSRVFAATPAPLADGGYLWPSDHLAVVSELRCDTV